MANDGKLFLWLPVAKNTNWILGGIAIGSWFWFEALARSDSKTDERQQQIKRYSEHQQIKKNTEEQNHQNLPILPASFFG